MGVEGCACEQLSFTLLVPLSCFELQLNVFRIASGMQSCMSDGLTIHWHGLEWSEA